MSSASAASPVKSRPGAPSMALRASVLEAAISVGFRNSVMKKWMFDPVEETDEDDHTERTSSTPALTSPSTSEESAMSPYNFFCTPGKPNSLSNSDSTPGYGPGPPLAGAPYLMNNNGSISQAGGAGYPYDDRNGRDAFGKLDLATAPLPRNKLRKQKTPPGGASDAGNGYESDGGYVSDFPKKAKNGLGWRSKGKSTAADNEDGDSDGGYRSEAASSAKAKARRKVKEKEWEKERNNKYFLHNIPSPPPPPSGLDVRDPGVLLDTIKASALSDPNSPTDSAPTSGPGPASSSGHGHTMTTTTTSALDGYLTDSASTEKRGRSKKKAKPGTSKSKSKSRPMSPSSSTEDKDKDALRKKKSLFRFRGRSASRDAKDHDRERGREEAPPPMPEWKPPVPLPIAERFARSGVASPVGGVSASASASTSVTKLEIASGLTKVSLELRSSGSLDTLVPPRLNEFARSDSPWSNRSAPGRIDIVENGTTMGAGGNSSGSASLDLPRERMESGTSSPFSFIQMPGDGMIAANGEKQQSGSQVQSQPQRSMSSIVTANVSSVNANSSNNGTADIGRSPTKRIGKLFTGFVHSSDKNKDKDSGASPSSSRTPIPIIHPNPQLNGKETPSLKIPSPLEIAAALINSGRSPKGNASPADESFMIIEEDDAAPTPLRQQRFGEADTSANPPSGNEQSSSTYLSPSADVAMDPSTRPASPVASALATRRRALLHGLGLDTTPTQSRSVTPVPGAIANEEDVKATRASVLAYYQVPPPSPPPKGPLPAPPQAPGVAISIINTSGVGAGPGLSSPRAENELLSPGRAFASRSPSPLGLYGGSLHLDIASRSPSPGSAANQFGVRRGRESPFPTRPILPPQDSKQLVERVERYKALYAADGATSDEGGDQEVIDKHSSEYIRQARARGEKRVYFDTRQSFISDHYADADIYGDRVDPAVPNIEVDEVDESNYPNGFDEDADERLRFSGLDSPNQIREFLREGVKGFDDDDGESEHLSSRRSFATSSVYSNYSVLEAEDSARLRDGLVRRVAALYEGNRDRGRLLTERIPEVPKVPSQFRGDGAAGQLGRAEPKIASSPYRF